jgi:hypothetical protein
MNLHTKELIRWLYVGLCGKSPLTCVGFTFGRKRGVKADSTQEEKNEHRKKKIEKYR